MYFVSMGKTRLW